MSGALEEESDSLATVCVDLYINQTNPTKPTKRYFSVKEQEGSTCYANAAAAVLHMAMKRIVGRAGGYPDFYKIRDKLIDKYGWDGASTLNVVKEVCPQYRLHCSQVDEEGAKEAIDAKRPVIATFSLTDQEWDSFSEFYKRDPRGILTRSEIDISKRPDDAELGGHAVVLASYNSERLRLMNSWGSDWADGGFFRVQNADVLGLKFVDVFWTLNDLRQEEKDAYARDGAKSTFYMRPSATECVVKENRRMK